MELCCAQGLESLYSTQPYHSTPPLKILEAVVHSSLKGNARNRALALLCACAFGLIAAGCHHQNTTSGYGVAWITMTDEPGDFSSYIVVVDSVVLTGKTYGAITAIATPELMDLTKLANYSELWSSAPIPVDTYISATVTLDFTDAQIYVQVNGVPVQATVVDSTGAAVTTMSLLVTLDPANQLTFQPTYASTNALRLAFDYDIAASSTVDLTTSPPTVTVSPYMTVATAAPDSKLIRVRGPLVNSSVNIGSYSTYVRPFFDEVNALGTLTIFNSASTVYTLGGLTYVGAPGITALSQTSAGATMTAAYCTFEPTPTLGAGITAGKFNSQYVIAGSTLEDFYTDGIEGDVIARSGNVLTLRGATLFANADQVVQYQAQDALVQLGTGTLVTADGVSTLGPLDYNSVSVGQHITARGLYSVSSTGVVTIDSTGTSDTNTGSVRLQSTELWGSLTSSASGSLVMNVQSIQDWPVANYDFTGNGATTPTAASFAVNTGSLSLPAGTVAGDLLWVDGFTSPFGTAPPDFIAEAINAAPTVPASMVVTWNATTGTTAPFATLSDSGLTIDLSNAALVSGVIRIGAQSIDMTTLAATPEIVPLLAPAPPAGLPPVYLPLFGVGSFASGVLSFNGYPDYVTQLGTTLSAPTAVVMVTARGTYNPGTNIFTASAIDALTL
jgi:hypothetical protein